MSKDVAEKTILHSLDAAFSDYAKPTSLTTKKKSKRNKEEDTTDQSKLQELPANFSEVIFNSNHHETVELVKQVEVVTNQKKPKKMSVHVLRETETSGQTIVEDTKPIKKRVSKKHNKLKGFFGKSSQIVSRETPKTERKTYKNKKSLYGRRGLFKSPFSYVGNRLANAYSNYKKNAVTAVLVLGMLGLVTATTYATYAYVSSKDADLIQNVAHHVILPQDEMPKIYIVQSSKADIFQNPLFKGIEVGDNVLTYSKAGKVFIYRSSEDKIVNIVNLQN